MGENAEMAESTRYYIPRLSIKFVYTNDALPRVFSAWIGWQNGLDI